MVKLGWHGRVVDSFPNWSSTTYSVKFIPDGDRGIMLTTSGLTEFDVQPDWRGLDGGAVKFESDSNS
jgi:hypothetical protein